MDRWVSEDGSIELRLGDYREVLADVEMCDALIADPPYSERTHRGSDELPEDRADLSYESWTPDDVREFVEQWATRTRGWMFAMTDHVLAPFYEAAYESWGRMPFAPVPLLQHRPRLVGDGPGSGCVHCMVSRPRTREFATWGSLPCWYESTPDRTGIVNGGKPLAAMCRIVADYSKPGDLIVDTCAGGATTLIAAGREGRRAIGAECDPATFRKAVARLEVEARTGIWRPTGSRMKQVGLF